ncbi:MAG: hypothetical protein JSS79_10255 [Bacteroidetes bacterium]|nr:hypothetical protein [Bacteroidota bacterium]
MRKLMLIFTGLAASLLARGQWSINATGDAVNNNSSKKVGIGVSTQVMANLQIGEGTGDGLLNLGGRTGIGSLRSTGDLFAGTNVYATYASSSENNLFRVLNTNSSGFSAVHFSSSGDVNFFTRGGNVTANDPISVTSATYNALKISGNGRVGIGTIQPGAQFTVALPPYTGVPANSSLVFFNQSSNPVGTDLKPALEVSNNGGSGFGLVSIAANNYLSGNVSIGTTSSDAKLTVKGQIHAQGVKVDLLGAITPPDYVFENDYKLMSLEEVKAFIDQNKHLPEVPSAKEMEKNGVQLLEMNMLLLKKIEELTLHLIDQKNELIVKSKQIEDLQKRLTSLENR